MSMHISQFFIAVFLAGLAYIAYRDWSGFRIPDHATLPLGTVGIFWIFLFHQEFWALHFAMAFGAGLVFHAIALLYHRFRGFEGLGYGDVKLVIVGGLWLGPALPLAIAIGTGIALIATLCLIAVGQRKTDDAIPLGFYLAVGFSVGLLL